MLLGIVIGALLAVGLEILLIRSGLGSNYLDIIKTWLSKKPTSTDSAQSEMLDEAKKETSEDGSKA